MILSEQIETDRLILRTLGKSDATPAYLSWLTDKEVNKFLEIRFADNQTIESLKLFIESMNASPVNLLLGIYLKKTAVHIGNIKLGPIILEHSRSELGFLIGEKTSWHKGYATEAISALSKYALTRLNLSKVTAGCYELNTGSKKALVNAGFEVEAHIPNNIIFNGERIGSYLFGYQE